MKISTKGKYALEIAADLALHSDAGHRESLKNIACRRGLSEKYLERIVKMLCSAGIVSGARGVRGGYCLVRDAQEITLLEILEASEGELAPVPCLTRETDCGIECDQCPTREVWGDMWQIIKKTAGEVTVADVCAKSGFVCEDGGGKTSENGRVF